MRGFLEAYELRGSEVWVADRFTGAEPADDAKPTSQPDLNTVREGFAGFGLLDDRVVFLQGPPAAHPPRGPDRGDRAAARGLRRPRGDPVRARRALRPRGAGRVRGRRWLRHAGCQAAVDAFRAERGIADPLERIDWSGASVAQGGWTRWTRPRGPHAARGELRPRQQIAAATELAVVVVVHNMRREAGRTLHSLSRSYQRGVDDLDYEVIVVENGSDPDQRLGEEFVRSFGEQFRYIDLGSDAMPSPARAINRGIAATGGRRRGADDRRRTRGHPGRPALRHARARDLRAGDRHGEAVVPGSGPAAADGRGRLRRGARGSSLRRDRVADRRVPACSRSATSSATATGSTGSGRATASSSPGHLIEQVGRDGRELLGAGRGVREPRLLRADGRSRRGSPM